MSSKTSKFDSDGFQIITKRSSKGKFKNCDKIQKQISGDYCIDVDYALKRIKSAIELVQNSDYWKSILNSVSTILKSRHLDEIICFGLGHISDCHIARHQLGLLLCLKEHFQPKRILVQDPIFYKDECVILKKLGLNIIEENCEGCYPISKGITLCYLPHCPKQLTNNFLWSNWGVQLENCILLCNSFKSLAENQPSRILLESVPFIHKITPFTSEFSLDNNFDYLDVFNDTSLHSFVKENLPDNPEFWSKTDKPSYKNTEEFITKLIIEKLNI